MFNRRTLPRLLQEIYFYSRFSTALFTFCMLFVFTLAVPYISSPNPHAHRFYFCTYTVFLIATIGDTFHPIRSAGMFFKRLQCPHAPARVFYSNIYQDLRIYLSSRSTLNICRTRRRIKRDLPFGEEKVQFIQTTLRGGSFIKGTVLLLEPF